MYIILSFPPTEHQSDVVLLILLDTQRKEKEKLINFCIFLSFSFFFHRFDLKLNKLCAIKFVHEHKKVPNIGDYKDESGEDKMPLVTIFQCDSEQKKIISHKKLFLIFSLTWVESNEKVLFEFVFIHHDPIWCFQFNFVLRSFFSSKSSRESFLLLILNPVWSFITPPSYMRSMSICNEINFVKGKPFAKTVFNLII